MYDSPGRGHDGKPDNAPHHDFFPGVDFRLIPLASDDVLDHPPKKYGCRKDKENSDDGIEYFDFDFIENAGNSCATHGKKLGNW